MTFSELKRKIILSYQFLKFVKSPSHLLIFFPKLRIISGSDTRQDLKEYHHYLQITVLRYLSLRVIVMYGLFSLVMVNFMRIRL